MKWLGTYHAAVSTPVSAGAVFAGHVIWICLRVLLSATVFLIVAVILGGVPSLWGVLAIPAAVLGASVFAAAAQRLRGHAGERHPVRGDPAHGALPAVPVLGHVLPDEPTARLAAAGVVVLAVVARGGAVPRRDHGVGAVGGLGGRAHRVPGRVPRRRLLVGRAPLQPGADRMISSIAVKEAGRRRVGRCSVGPGDGRAAGRRAQHARVPAACGSRSSPACSSRCSTCCRSASAWVGWSGKVPGPGGQPIPYDQFVAPGLMAAAAMNGAVLDTTFNFFFKFKYAHTYDAMLATPLEVGDIARGELLWALIRGGIYSAVFLVTMVDHGAGELVVGAARAAGGGADRATGSPGPGSRPRPSCGRGPTSTS